MIILLLLLCLFLIIHSFMLPLILRQIPVKERPLDRENKINMVSIILPAYNEEASIIEKLTNLQKRCNELSTKHEVLIGSDGSSDDTVKRAQGFVTKEQLNTWKVFEFENSGKGQTINRLVEKSTGDIIASTDCDTTLKPNALEKGFREFMEDPSIGCLSSVPEYELGAQSIQETYWSFDLTIRKEESRLGRLIVLNGWLYFFRKNSFRPIPVGVMADDLWIPLTVILNGEHCKQCPSSIATCNKTDETTELYKRRRVIAGGIDVVHRLSSELTRVPFLFFLVFSHKINRWLLPVWLLCFLLLFLQLFEWNLSLLVILGFLFVIGLSIQKIRSILLTLALPFLSVLDVIREKDLSKWEHVGRDNQANT